MPFSLSLSLSLSSLHWPPDQRPFAIWLSPSTTSHISAYSLEVRVSGLSQVVPWDRLLCFSGPWGSPPGGSLGTLYSSQGGFLPGTTRIKGCFDKGCCSGPASIALSLWDQDSLSPQGVPSPVS
jgi:hypothetical protein